ncbi:uncharacterized protein LOC130817604 isoform X1 [Amaranthus tricolor]|uniref:uncharacterized protein LOC130817604 isoform X1 n=1 Tax=Amaranthus tricolor TaxID=29722 RepID=UPI002583E71C|nr:uncharacterized protein LOC130817604 isoform X1 [Amaranthus tricolor]
MTIFSPLSIATSTCTCNKNPIHIPKCNFLPKSLLPIKIYYLRCTKIGAFSQNMLKKKLYAYRNGFLHGVRTNKDGILGGEKKRFRVQKRVVLVKFNQGFNFNGGGGGDRRGDGTTARVLGNLALAVGLTYLTMTGQLGWVLDTIVSLWLLAIILPIVGIGVFLWWAGRDIVQSTCPNCGNPFQVFKSTLQDEVQLCPYCSQPFSVEGNEFVKEPIQFSKRSSPFGQPFDDLLTQSKTGKNASKFVVDVEAEVKDAE